jgi:predicted amidophosphoribosyltransferase
MCERSRLLRTFLKAGDEAFMRKYAWRVREQAKNSPPLAGFFGPSDLLVPVPGSTPYSAGKSWASQDLAAALVEEGLGRAAWTGLHRVCAVRKSATAAPGTRPTVNLHYDSFYVERPPEPPEGIVLIDDVITKGRTLLAAASRLHDAFPAARIRGFALLRTLGLISSLEHLLCPCKGQIRWRGGDAHRSP